jgi:hypothetical protein
MAMKKQQTTDERIPSRHEAAALAMAGILAAGGHRDRRGAYDFESMAEAAYFAADALDQRRRNHRR